MAAWRRNTPIFAISQGLMMSSVSLIVICSALVGQTLSTDKSLATLPIAVMFIATMLMSMAAGYLQHQFGWQMVNMGALPILVVIMLSISMVGVYQDSRYLI